MGDFDDEDYRMNNESYFKRFMDDVKKEMGSSMLVRYSFRYDRDTFRFRGTIILSFDSQEEAERCMDAVDGKDFNYVVLRPEWLYDKK